MRRASTVSFGYRHPFARYVAIRIGLSIGLLWGITLVTFVLTNMVPANPALAALGDRAASDPKIVETFNRQYGFDKPRPVQYWLYLVRVVHLDLGQSTQTHNPVMTDLKSVFPATAELTLTALVIAAVLGIAMGLYAALRHRTWKDQLIRVISLLGVSTPAFWMALVVYFVFFYKLGWFPGSGRLDSALLPPPHVTGFYTIDALLAGQTHTFVNACQHLILPSSVLVGYNVGFLARFTRSSVLDVRASDFVTTARAKGLPPWTVTMRYILRAALVPILTVIGLAFAGLLSGAVLTETVFSWGGLGQYAYKAAITIDLHAIMGVGILIGVIYIMINFAVDLLYGLADPRVRAR